MVDFAALKTKRKVKPVAEDNITLTGRIDKLFVAVPGFSAGKILVIESNGNRTRSLESFSAKQQLSEGMNVKLYGSFVTDPKYGSQFKVSSVDISLEMDADGLALWLAKNKKLVGIGESKGRLIADTFANSFDDIVLNHPDQIQTMAKLSDDSMACLQSEWKEHRATIELTTWLAAFELSIREIDAIKERFGNEAIAILTDNPYLLIREIPRFAFKRVDAIARKMGVAKGHQGRIRQGIVWCVRDALEQGDTYIERSELVRRAIVLLEPDTPVGKKKIEDLINDECFMGKAIVEKQIPGNGLPTAALPRSVILDRDILRFENYIAETIWQTQAMPNRHFASVSAESLDSLIDRVGGTLKGLQREAIQLALTKQLCVVSGGAGTGKTYTLTTLCNIYEEMGLSVSLCAPTGKAARRLEQTTGREAQTIHRLLDYNPRVKPEWGFNESNQLRTDLVIIDETSMVDSRLAYRLLSAVNYKRTAILWVGDHHQLPPVGPGNLLRDMMGSLSVHKVVLTEVVRQAGILEINSTKILEGIVEKTCRPVADEKGSEDGNEGASTDIPWQVISTLRDPVKCQQFVVAGVRAFLEGWPDADIVSDIQILTPQKERDLGTKALNMELQRLVQQLRYNVIVETIDSKRRPKFYQHDKVIQVKNDYDLDVMNGTIGQIVDIKAGVMHVQFEGRDDLVKISGEKQNNIQLAYALTIHKSQGSEFPFVILVVHKNHSFMNNRNLLYTGCTRASKKLIIVGDPWGISNCAKTKVVDKRKTWLSTQI